VFKGGAHEPATSQEDFPKCIVLNALPECFHMWTTNGRLACILFLAISSIW